MCDYYFESRHSALFHTNAFRAFIQVLLLCPLITSIPLLWLFVSKTLKGPSHSISCFFDRGVFTNTKSSFLMLNGFLLLFLACLSISFIFQKAITACLGDLPYVNIYIDDILIFSKSIEDHYEHLKSVFDILLKNNICINYDKSVFAQSEVQYLDRIISADVFVQI